MKDPESFQEFRWYNWLILAIAAVVIPSLATAVLLGFFCLVGLGLPR